MEAQLQVQPEKRSRLERMTALADRRQLVASRAAAVDALFQKQDGFVTDEEIEAAFPEDGLSQRAKNIRALVIREFKRVQERMEYLDSVLQEVHPEPEAGAESIVYKLRVAVEGKDSAESVRLAKEVFHDLTGEKPLGQVTFERQGTFFLMICHDTSDFSLLDQGSREIDAEKKSGGSFGRIQELVLPENSSGRKSVFIPLITIDGTIEHQDSIIAHETQHAINASLLKEFEHARPVPKKWRSSEWAHYQEEFNESFRVKDEVLAFLKDGEINVAEILNPESHLYGHLFDAMSEPEWNEQTKESVIAIDAALKRLHASKGGAVLHYDLSRTALVYQLVDLPLSKIAEYIDTLSVYYSKKIERLEECRVDEPDFYGALFFPLEERKKITIQLSKTRKFQAWIQYKRVFRDVERDILLASGDEIAQQLQKLEEARDTYVAEVDDVTEQMQACDYVHIDTVSELAPDSGEVLYSDSESQHIGRPGSSKSYHYFAKGILETYGKACADGLDLADIHTILGAQIEKFSQIDVNRIWVEDNTAHDKTVYIQYTVPSTGCVYHISASLHLANT